MYTKIMIIPEQYNDIKFNDYVSFVRGVKAANNELFKAFYNEVQMEQKR